MSSGLLILNLGISIAIILVCIMVFKLNAVVGLVIASLYMGVSCGLGWMETVNLIGSGFGSTMTSMGVSIIFGVIIGAVLMGVINQGMSIMGISSNYQRAVKGVVLLAAVLMDILSKKEKA